MKCEDIYLLKIFTACFFYFFSVQSKLKDQKNIKKNDSNWHIYFDWMKSQRNGYLYRDEMYNKKKVFFYLCILVNSPLLRPLE